MALGPELVLMQAMDISREFERNKVRRASAGDSWLALAFSRDRSLFFSWDPEYYGLCLVLPGEARTLEEAASSRPPLLDAVRSHIAGSELFKAARLYSDRVLKIDFRRVIGAGFFQERSIIFEPCGRYSNIIVADEAGRVIEAAKHILPDSNRYRTIIPGSPYSAPPDLDGVLIEDFDERAPDINERLDCIRGLGKPLITALKELPPRELAAAVEFYKNPSGEAAYQFLHKPRNYLTVCPIKIPGSAVSPSGDSLAAARPAVVSGIIGRRVDSCRKKISSRLDVIERANDRKIGEYAALVSDRGEVERLKREGTLILACSHMIPPRASSALLTEWTSEGPVELKVILDPDKNPSSNAEARFAKYRRKKSAVEAARKILPPLYQKKDELREQRAMLEINDDWNTLAMMLRELDPKVSKKKGGRGGEASADIPPHRRIEFPDHGAVIFYGLSARGNRYVTFKLAKGGDIWFHARNVPGAHVILRFSSPPDGGSFSFMADAAASCAVRHSLSHAASGVNVDYTERRHVRAIQGAGPANVTYKEFKTVRTDSSLWLDVERCRSGRS
ncbi:MAG: NFACT family protein [Synergistaceae bacterium]|nr:NFACT family protein [Synergistaceae bacterium]